MVARLHIFRKRLLVSVLLLTLALSGMAVVYPHQASAAQLQGRSLHIQSAQANAINPHTFRFSYMTTNVPVTSVMFEYCTSPLFDLPCDAPAGLDASAAVLTDQQGEGGFSILAAQINRIVLTRTTSTPAAVSSSYLFDGIVNPDGTPSTFYVRITTHQSPDASDAYTDFGSVVNAITEGIDVNSEVPPILSFCVGLTIDSDCSSAEGNLIDLGNLTTASVSRGSSQMLAATNAALGLAIGVYGTTMTSGNNTIAALTAPTVSAPGNAQFGLNLRDNTNPDIGQEPSGIGIITPTASYNIPNRYTFNSGDIVATSTYATNIRKLTSSYIVNVPPNQAPGVYTATLTYICTATF